MANKAYFESRQCKIVKHILFIKVTRYLLSIEIRNIVMTILLQNQEHLGV